MENEIINYFQERQYHSYTGLDVAKIIADLTKPKRKTLDISYLSKEDIDEVMRIVEAVEQVTGMHFDTFNVRNKKDMLITPRHLFMYLIKDRMKLTLGTIGRIMGGRDHSTVIHALHNVENWITNPLFYKRENKLIDDTRRYLEASEIGQG